MRSLGIDCGTERTGYGVIESDGRDHRLVCSGVIVAPAKAVVDTQYRFEIREQVLPRQELADHRTDDGRATEPTADQYEVILVHR